MAALGRPVRLLVALCMGAAVYAAGCGRPSAAPATPPVTLPNPSTLPSLPAIPAWTADLPTPTTLSLSQDGKTVAGFAPTGPWAYSAHGIPSPLPSLQGSAVWALPAGRIAVGPGMADPAGPVSVVSAQGTILWSAPAVGPILAVGNAKGDRILVTDDGTDTVTELTLGSGGKVGQVSLGRGTAAAVANNGDALVYSATRVTLYSAVGRTLWTQALNRDAPPRTFALDAGASGVTVATTGRSYRLYQFAFFRSGTAPTLVWSGPLSPGGIDRVTAGPGGRVAVWGIGGTATLAVYRQSDGMRLWEDTMPVGPGSSHPMLTGLTFTSGGGVVASLTGCLASGAPCLLVLNSLGAPLGAVPMPLGSRVDLASGGRAAVAIAASGPKGATLSWYSLGRIVAART